MSRVHCVVPDCQVRPGDDVSFLTHLGNYIVAKQPDVLVCLGDFADMPSLSSYDVGRKSFEGRRYKNDVEATKEAMKLLLAPIKNYNERQRKNGKKQYKPEMHLTLGNHEARINRAVEDDAKLEGVLSIDDLQYESFGWNVYPFLDVCVIDGVAYSHYFTTGLAGRPAGTASAQLNKKHQSCIAGHQQGFQVATARRADNKKITSIIAGSCYTSHHDYLGAQGNHHDRGFIMLYDVEDGEFEHNFITLKFLEKKYS